MHVFPISLGVKDPIDYWPNKTIGNISECYYRAMRNPLSQTTMAEFSHNFYVVLAFRLIFIFAFEVSITN